MDARKKAEDDQTEKHKEVKKHQKDLHKLEKAAAEKVSTCCPFHIINLLSFI